MSFRTDLAIEISESLENQIDDIYKSEDTHENAKINRIEIKTKGAAERFGKAIGTYITVEIPALTDNFDVNDNRITIISNEIKQFIPKKGTVLVVGLGNYNITPDALGPKTANTVLATRHISEEIAKSTGLSNLRSVCVLAPGVLGQTGIEVSEIISSLVKKLNPSCAILIDALASRSLSRLGCTVQISNTGISPGSGVDNARPLISEENLGIPVISIGVPTVVDATTLAQDILSSSLNHSSNGVNNKILPKGKSMIVTPREIDVLINRASLLISMAINCALHTEFSPGDLYSLVS